MMAPSELEANLKAFFNINIKCSPTESGKIEIDPGVFDRGCGCRVLLDSPFCNLCRTSLEFDTYAAPLVRFWFDNPANIKRAFEFANNQSLGNPITILIGDKRTTNAEEFLSAKDSDWRTGRLSVSLSIRSDGKHNGDIAAAISMVGFVLYASGCAVESQSKAFAEGEPSTIRATRYERDPHNRAACIEHYGTTCYVCGLDLKDKYGSLADGLIEVHHKTPISSYGKSIAVDPIRDLVPLCPNCHAVVHRRNPPIDPDELARVVRRDVEQ